MNEEPVFLEENERIGHPIHNSSTLTKRETRRVIAGALCAGLLVGAVFLIACFLFLLFCVYVWFR